jgi:hypothetical protein
MELDYIVPPSLVDRGPGALIHLEKTPYVSKWIVDPQPGGWWEKTLSRVVRKASDPFILWFRNRHSEASMLHMLGRFALSNPHAVLSVVFEFSHPPRLSFLRESLETAGDPGIFLNRSYAPLHGENTVVSPDLTIIVPDPGDPAQRKDLVEEYAELARIVWDFYGLPQRDSSETPLPLLMSRSLSEVTDQCASLFRGLKSVCEDRPEEVLFRDAALQMRWNEYARGLDPSRRLPEKILLDV